MGKRWRWGVILDAGSSGTRVYVYKWKDPAKQQKDVDDDELQSLPKLKTKDEWTKKIRPGISSFGAHPEDVGDEHLKQLLDHALSIVPEDKIVDTPFFLMATAGMRLLPQGQQHDILDQVCTYVRQNTQFSLPDCSHQIRVIPGETEGLYGWIATNYLLGGFDKPESHNHGKGHHTYGFLDMGGASAQIAFAPNSTEAEKHANDLKLLRLRKVSGQADEHQVFTASWLGFGVNQARGRYVDALEDKYEGGETEIPDPCMPRGLRTTPQGDLVESASVDGGITLAGTGKFGKCLLDTYPLLGKDAPCEDEPCLLNGQHVPAIDFDVNHFIGVSEYWHTTHGVFGGSGNKAYDFNTYQHHVIDFCSQNWEDIEEAVATHKKASKNKKEIKNAQEACFKASWLTNVLHDGIGIPRVGIEHTGPPGLNASQGVLEDAQDTGFLDPFQPVDEIDHIEVSWTLGPMVLYASGQVPPTGSSLAVGFGSNVKDKIPPDFQHAGSNYTLGTPEDDGWSDAADDIIETATSSGGPSFLFFILTMLILAFLLRHRERRRRIFGWIGMFSRRRRKPGSPRTAFRSGTLAIANKIFGRSSAGYERVMEEGDFAQFELGDVESDDSDHSGSSEGSRLGQTSGLATPTLNMDGRFDDPRKGLSGFDRSGLAVRTESRERLVPPHMLSAGRRSRATSPTRMKSSLAPTYEHD
ncbi:hypothetical protein MKZ38_001166 [Zalerion maritima]|uniref:Golgi apyrase n=1 Tax=Zalerion maritima TaxID=339359 RepID=A0AAD5WTA2_9PEZI|nr:hypothetical protein MKZ38_001166 [Zalerion maritima]